MRMPVNIRKIPIKSRSFKEHIVMLPDWRRKNPTMALNHPGDRVDDETIRSLAIYSDDIREVIYHEVQGWYAIKMKRGEWYEWRRENVGQ